MSTPTPEGSTTGEEAAGRTQAKRYADDAWLKAYRANRRMAVERRLEARHVTWASRAIGGSLYMHTMRVLKWKGNDSLGSKINKRSQVAAELGISTGEALGRLGGDFHSAMVGGD